MTTPDVKALLNSNGQSKRPMRGWVKKRAAEDTSLEGASSKKAAAAASTPGHAHAEQREPEDAPPTTTEVQEALPPEGVSWNYHHTQIDESNKYQSKSSKTVRRNFQDLLMGDQAVYKENFQMVSRMNPALAGAIRDHTVSQRNMPRYEKARSLFGYQDDSDASDTEEEAAAAGVAGFARFGRERRCDERWAQNHSRTCEFIMSIMQRWYNMHSHCFLLYSFSCILFATGASEFVWGLLLSMRVVYSKEIIRDSMLQVGRRIMEIGWNATSSSLGFNVFDNCGYMNKLTYQHAEKNGHFYETVNYFYFPLRRLRSGKIPELPSSGAHVVLVRTVRCQQAPDGQGGDLRCRRSLAGPGQVHARRRSRHPCRSRAGSAPDQA